jgi:putative salt-induced outer membrane protein YdiY
LDQQLNKAVAAYIDDYFEPETAGACRVSDIIRYDMGYIKKHLVKRGNTFEEKLQMSFGPMYQTHALLEFGPEFRKELENRRGDLKTYARERAIAFRLRGLALGFGAVLCLLTVIYGYLRLDTATRGYYAGRLQFLAATAILIVIVAGAWLASRVMWM